MKRVEPFRELSATPFLLRRQACGFGRYMKTAPRDPEKWRILLRLYLNIIAKRERDDYIPLGPRRRRVKIT
jgi:hypothetical protein